MNDILSSLIEECASEADCFIGAGLEHVHARERLVAVAPHFYLTTSACPLRAGDRIWFEDLHERVTQRQVSGQMVLLRTIPD